MITSQHTGKQLKETEAQGIRRRREPMEHLNVPIRATRRRKGVEEAQKKNGKWPKRKEGRGAAEFEFCVLMRKLAL